MKNLIYFTVISILTITSHATPAPAKHTLLQIRQAYTATLVALKSPTATDAQKLELVQQTLENEAPSIDAALMTVNPGDYGNPSSELAKTYRVKDILEQFKTLKLDDRGNFTADSCSSVRATLKLTDDTGRSDHKDAPDTKVALSILFLMCG